MTKSKKILIAVLSIPFLIFTYATVTLYIAQKANGTEFSYQNGGTDLTFQSSDGTWFAEEDLIRGKDFENVVVSFELYKIRCKKPELTLLRTKPRKRAWQWAWWFDDYAAAKWKVPYAEMVAPRDVRPDNCRPDDATEAERATALANANQFIANLALNLNKNTIR